MARKLSVRNRGGVFEVGPTKHGPTVMVSASNAGIALKLGKEELRVRDELKGSSGLDGFNEAVRQSYRFHSRADRRLVDTRVDSLRILNGE